MRRLFNNRRERSTQRLSLRPVGIRPQVLTDANGMQYSPAPVQQEQVVIDDQTSTVSAESAAKPVIKGRSQNIFGVKIVNASADTAYDALFLDANGNVARDLSQTNNADLTISSTTHDYDSFLEELKTIAYQVEKVVFRTSTGDEAVLDNKLKQYRYNNGPGAANVFETIVPSSGISASQYNLNVYEVMKMFKLDGNVGGLINMPADTTINIYFYFQ